MTETEFAIRYYEAHPWILWFKIIGGPIAMIIGLMLLTISAAETTRAEEQGYARGVRDMLCSDCPPPDYPIDETRCAKCPRRAVAGLG